MSIRIMFCLSRQQIGLSIVLIISLFIFQRFVFLCLCKYKNKKERKKEKTQEFDDRILCEREIDIYMTLKYILIVLSD